MLFHVGFIACTLRNLFTAIEMEEGDGHFVDPTNGVQDVLATLRSTLALFKNLTNFIATKFEDLASFVMLTIIFHVRSINPYCLWETIKVKP